MEVFGWIVIWLLALFGIGILILFAIPFIISECKSVTYKTLKEIEDKKININEISKARQLRNARLRDKQNELAEKKLSLKMNKLNKKCSEEQKKIDLTEEMSKENVEIDRSEKEIVCEELKNEVKHEEEPKRVKVREEDIIKVEEIEELPKDAEVIDEVEIIASEKEQDKE